MTIFSVDVEADGPIPGDYSMVCFGVVVVEPQLDRTFYGQLKPVSNHWIPDALKVSGFSREQTLEFDDPKVVMTDFAQWVTDNCGTKSRAMFFADNPGFDWQFINYYFHHFLGRNPFGHSQEHIGSMYKGLKGTLFTSFKRLRKTKHSHNPVDDAKGNAEALLQMKEKMGMHLPLE